jgi:hypothetical protein
MAKLLHKLRKFNYVPHATTRRERGVILGPIMKPRPQPSIGRMLYLTLDQTDISLDTFTSFSPPTIWQIGKPALLC